MPQGNWRARRERRYRHVKQSQLERGRPEDGAGEIAARTVDKARARAGEAETAGRTALDDLSSGRRGGLRSQAGAGGRT